MPDATPGLMRAPLAGTATPRVVIVGGGFGGLAVAGALRRAAVAVTLIDRENHHTFQPLLYQAATAALSTSDIAWPIRSLLKGQANARVVMAEVVGIDRAARRVHTDGPSFDYDYLVLATGSTHSYFGHDDWAGVAPGLKKVGDAAAIRKRILLAFERAEVTTDIAEQVKLLTFVVIGGGATGVEMAGAIAEVARDTLKHDFREIDPTEAQVILVEGGPRLLASLPDDLSAYAQTALGKLGVDVRTGVQVTGCDTGGVDTTAGRIDAATLIWAAGVRASPAAQWLGVVADKAGRVPVQPDLTIPGHPEISVIGDTAAALTQAGKPVPGVAPAAKQMGQFAGRRIAALVAGRAAKSQFSYQDQGELATVGRKSAVLRIGRFKLTGGLAWVFWGLVHILFLVTVRDRVIVSLNWMWNYVTFQRGARVVTRLGE